MVVLKRRVRAFLAVGVACLALLACAVSLPPGLRPGPPRGETPLVSGAEVTAQATAGGPGVVRTVIVTVGPDAAAPPTPLSDAALDALAQQSFASVNAERAALGLTALTWDEDIHTLTTQVAGYLAQNHLFSHWLPDAPDTTVSSLFGGRGACGENLALHYSAAAIGAEDWHESPPHYEVATTEEYARGAASVSTVQSYVRVFSPAGSAYGAQDESVHFGGTEYILVFRACE